MLIQIDHKIIRGTFFMLIANFLAACGGYVPRVYPAVMVPEMMSQIEANKNFKVADNTSFSNAIMLYPTRTGDSDHRIPVGNYLLSRAVLALPDDAGLTKIRLDEYRSECESRGVFGPHLWCTTNAQLTIAIRGKDQILHATDEVDVGPVYIPGDMSLPCPASAPVRQILEVEERRISGSS
jgi:hypothetical protein